MEEDVIEELTKLVVAVMMTCFAKKCVAFRSAEKLVSLSEPRSNIK